MTRFRRFDADADDYVELDQPEPWRPEHAIETRQEMHRAWLKEQSEDE